MEAVEAAEERPANESRGRRDTAAAAEPLDTALVAGEKSGVVEGRD